jgi:tetratricopeptide (TPR) repeat protein
MADKVYNTHLRRVSRDEDDSDYRLFKTAIEDNAVPDTKGKFTGLTFDKLIQYPWFNKIVSTKYPLFKSHEESMDSALNKARGISRDLCIYFRKYNNKVIPLLEDIARYRIWHCGDVNLSALLAERLMSRGAYSEAFKICDSYRMPEESEPWDYAPTEKVQLMLGEMYEYGLGTGKDIHKAIDCYMQCYDAPKIDCAYYIGRCYEKLGNDESAMKYYREIIDDGNYRETSHIRHNWNSEQKKYKFHSLPYRLEISFRKLKKKKHPNRYDVLEVDAGSRYKLFIMELHILMNAVITIDWGDGHTTIEKWKVNGWHFIGHEYTGERSWHIKITSDEENVIMGFRPLTPYSVKSINFDRCKGLMYLICPDQNLERLDLSSLHYLREINVHANKLRHFSISGLHNLTSLDISNNSLKFEDINIEENPVRLLSVRGNDTSSVHECRIKKQIELNMGHIIGPFYPKEQHDIYPTVGYYIRNSKWKHIRGYIKSEYPKATEEYFDTAKKAYELLLKETSLPSPEGLFLEADSCFVYPCRRWKDERGVYTEGWIDGENFYLTMDNPWDVVLGTPIRDARNRMPFMRLPQRRNAYFAAMCLINLIENKEEMKRHGLEPIDSKWLGEG